MQGVYVCTHYSCAFIAALSQDGLDWKLGKWLNRNDFLPSTLLILFSSPLFSSLPFLISHFPKLYTSFYNVLFFLTCFHSLNSTFIISLFLSFFLCFYFLSYLFPSLLLLCLSLCPIFFFFLVLSKDVCDINSNSVVSF